MESLNDLAWKPAREHKAYLALENGTILTGYSVGAEKNALGLVIFNTSAFAYEEILSDPSSAGQIVCFTNPELGNAGMNPEDMQSSRLHAAGLLALNLNRPANWRATESLRDALVRHGVPALAGIDTRELTALIRDHGAMKAYLSVDGAMPMNDAVEKAKNWSGLAGHDYAAEATCKQAHPWDAGNSLTAIFPRRDEILPPADYLVVAYDFGVKTDFLRSLRRNGMAVTVVPAQTPAAEVLAMKPDGIFLSNGPGDPNALPYAVENVRTLLGKTPILGVGLGHELLALSVKGETYQLPFGHHGEGHPVKDIVGDRSLATSQNHNFAVWAESIPDRVAEITHLSLNDATVEGMRLRDYPAFSVQFHPDGGAGKAGSDGIFKDFYGLIVDWSRRRNSGRLS